MIVVTGAAGFIGSNLVRGLNERGLSNILAVDDLTDGDKFVNLVQGRIADYMHKDDFRRAVREGFLPGVRAVFHQGACSDTTERNGQYMMDNNYRYTVDVLDFCIAQRVPFLYASSAATYGASSVFKEERQHEAPLNVYGYSKFLFDQIVRQRLPQAMSQVVGFRYFNVYGPRESHKGRMASVAFHHYNQFRADGKVRLFEGCDGYADGEQKRDFVYVGDVAKVNLYFLDHPEKSGIFNLGTGRAQSFNELAAANVNSCRALSGAAKESLDALRQQGFIEYIPFPEALKGKYQSFTQADLSCLRAAGYDAPFASVEEGVAQYVQWLDACNGLR